MNNLFKVILDFPRPFGAALRVTQKGIEKYFTHAVGSPLQTSNFYKDSTPAGGFYSRNTKIFLPKEAL